MSEVIYRRPAVSRTGWLIPLVLWALSSIALMVFSTTELTRTQVVICLLGPGVLFLVWLNLLYSLKRYGDITVTRDTLRVGRHERRIAHLDPHWLADPANTSTLPADRQVGDLLGGAWGSTLGGGDLVTLQLVDGTRVSVQTKDREGLVAALRQAVGSPA